MSTKISIFLLALLVLTVPTTMTMAYGSLAMGNCKELENCEEQRDRVGADDDEVNRDGPDDDGESSCWGDVTSDGARTLDPGEFGQHAANPTGDEDNDTPRENSKMFPNISHALELRLGVGNQDEDHPSDHADSVGGAFSDEDCIDED